MKWLYVEDTLNASIASSCQNGYAAGKCNARVYKVIPNGIYNVTLTHLKMTNQRVVGSNPGEVTAWYLWAAGYIKIHSSG
jgi:hypothetical protein